ncbi:transglycosylase SLT domain-containing protein [Desertibaculum subflavum]|uniref:transglycosylase SLT domain-containing protein n=1 Tax=Desertibaculum subflavum TaxID=2268458 RepID=UPI0013C40C13
MLRLLRGLGLIAVILASTQVAAKADPCGAAIERAARLTGVPVSLLRAIGEVESGVQLGERRVAWPWAVNDGRSLFFRNRAAAAAHVDALVAAGKSNVDIGCLQVNWHWHGEAFDAPADMLDPAANALYAARYLAALRRELGSWAAAVSAYHSRRETRAGAYRCRVASRLRPELRPSDCGQHRRAL